jgi:hypothetical protein
MPPDLQNLHPDVDDHTRTVIDEAAEVLGFLRGCRGPFLHDPAIRLHLLESLHRQLTTDLMASAADLVDDDNFHYNRDDLTSYLDRNPRPPRHPA